MPDHYDEEEKKNKRGSTSFDNREKFGTEFLDTLGDRINETGFGKFRQKQLNKQLQIQQALFEDSSELERSLLFPEQNQTEANILKGISDATQIDERISTPLTYMALGAGAKGLSKVKPKHLGITQTVEPYTPPKGLGKTPRNMVNITNQVDEVFNMQPTRVQQIVRIAKKNKISYKKAEQYLNLKEKGVMPSETLNPGTNAGLMKAGEGVNDPTVYIPPEERIGTQKGDPLMIDLGLPAFRQSRKKESVTDYRNRHFNQAQFQKDENGNFIFDDRLLKKNIKGEARRLTSQLAQTKPSQTVKSSFERTREKTKLPFVDELGGYMKLTGSKPNLHHRFAAMVVAPVYRGLALDDTPGSEWVELTNLFNEYNIYPGSPVTDPDSLGGPQSNLTQVVTKGFNQKVVLPDGTEKVIRRPPEPHDILHHQYYKEVGLQDVEEGKSSWFDKRMYKITGSREGRMEVARELAEIVNEGDRIIDAAMGQIRALFGKKTDPQVITNLLSEMAETGKLKITGTKFRLKSVEAIVDIIKKEVQANLPLADEQEVLNTVAQYNLDYDQEIEAIDLLHNIADYNESMRVFGKRPPSITTKQHKQNIDKYMDLIQTKLPLEIPVEAAKKEGLKTYTYKRVKLQPIDKQLELLFSDDGTRNN